MRISIKEVSFAVFFLIVIALVAVEAAESYGLSGTQGDAGIELVQ